MTPEEKRQYVDDLKKRAQTSVERADSLLTDLAIKSARLQTDVKAMHKALNEQLSERSLNE